MSDDPERTIEDLIAANLIKEPRNPKASARQKYNRRKIWLANALGQMDRAIDEMLAQGGKVYKRQEAETLKAAIATLRDSTGLTERELEPLTQEQLDNFTDMLTNLKPWEPPSKDEMAKLYEEIGLSPPSEQDD